MHIEIAFYENHLTRIAEVGTLYAMKNELQVQVTDPNLNWRERMFIYKKVQLILYRIRELVAA